MRVGHFPDFVETPALVVFADRLIFRQTAALAAANVRAEIEVYPDAPHGWCVPDSKAASNQPAVELAGVRL